MSKAIAWMFSRLEALLGWKKVPMGLVGADYLGNPQWVPQPQCGGVPSTPTLFTSHLRSESEFF